MDRARIITTADAIVGLARSNNRGDRARGKFLQYLYEHPGLMVGACIHQHEEVRLMVDADGGCMWYCARCDNFSSPNGPCCCSDERVRFSK